jgi:hypothetical protein
MGPPDKRTGPQVATPEARPNVKTPPTASDAPTVQAGTVRDPRCGWLHPSHLTGCKRPAEPGSQRCAEHRDGAR